MGGGDLNTKKSWHPNTMRNQEKVWKAEQAEAKEKRKIDDLRREIDNERSKEELVQHGQISGVLAESSSKKMDWMYKQPHESVDHEQYLLGKKIDKTFEKLVSQENTSLVKPPPKNHVEHECIPFSIRNLGTDITSREYQVDMARKMMEDPLVAIRQRELESRTQLLQNPVKLKELTMLLKNEQLRKKDKKKKKSSRESPDIDRKLAEKLNKLKGAKDKDINLEDLLSSRKSKKKSKKKRRKSLSDNDSEEDTPRKEKHKRNKYSDREDSQKSEETTSRHSDKKELSTKDRNRATDREYTKYKNNSTTHHSTKRYSDSSDDDQPPKKKNYGLVRADGTKIEVKKTHSESHNRQSVPVKTAKPIQKSYNKKMSAAEKEERRKEMMKDASERDKERERNVSYYREQDKRQEDRDKKLGYKEGFVEKHLRETTKHLSVESRIKSNVYNIQRSSRHMDTNFAKR